MRRHWMHHHYSTYLFYKFGIDPHTIIDVWVYDYSYAQRYKDVCEIVYAYEPNKTLFNKILEKQKQTETQTYYLNNIFLENKAISNFVGTAKFNEDLENAGCSSLLDNIPNNHSFTTYEVECNTLDNEFVEYDFKIDYIKIDTEWNDIFVLQGAKEIIKKHTPIIQVHHYETAMDEVFTELEYQKIETPSNFFKFYFIPKKIWEKHYA